MPDTSTTTVTPAELIGRSVLTLTQPWASLVVIGAKMIETRSWYTNYRGPLLIHAAKGYPAWAQAQVTHAHFWDALRWGGLDPHALPLGAILGRVTLTDVQDVGSPVVRALLDQHADTDEDLFGNYEPGRLAWILADPVRFAEPIPARGALGLWTYTGGTHAASTGV